MIKTPKSTALTGYKRDIDDYTARATNVSSGRTSTPNEQMGARVLKRIKTGKSERGDNVHVVTKQNEMKNNVAPHAFVQFNPIVSLSGALQEATKQGQQGIRGFDAEEEGRAQGPESQILINRPVIYKFKEDHL